MPAAGAPARRAPHDRPERAVRGRAPRCTARPRWRAPTAAAGPVDRRARATPATTACADAGRPHAASSSTRPATRAITTASGTRARAAGSPATPSALSYREFDHLTAAWITAHLRAGAVRARAAAGLGDSACSSATRRACTSRTTAASPTCRAAGRGCCWRRSTTLAAIGERQRDADDRHARLCRELTALYRRRLTEHGCRSMSTPRCSGWRWTSRLNAQGLASWLDRTSRG